MEIFKNIIRNGKILVDKVLPCLYNLKSTNISGIGL